MQNVTKKYKCIINVETTSLREIRKCDADPSIFAMSGEAKRTLHKIHTPVDKVISYGYTDLQFQNHCT